MDLSKITSTVKDVAKRKLIRTVLNPLDEITDKGIMDVTTSIGAFIVRSIQGKFQRSITFNIGKNWADGWMEEALYGILYKYNNIKQARQLEITNKGENDGSRMYYRLDDGTHNLKYRQFNIILHISTVNPQTPTSRVMAQRVYTIITFDLSPEFVTLFEKDMILHRNSLLKIKSDSPTISIYQDCHENDGYTYWDKMGTISKRRLNTIYLPTEKKQMIVETLNNFFASREYYKKHGIPHNLKILLYGPPGPQPVSISIPTPSGMKRFGDLQIGDKVFDRLGHPTTVTEIHPKGIQDVYEITFLDGRTARCTKDHLWKIFYRSHGEWKEDVVPLQHILDTSSLVDIADGTTLICGEKRYSIPMNGAAQFDERPISIDPYVMGIIITNGCLTDKYFRISQPTDEVPKRIANILGLEYSRRSSSECDYSYIFYNSNGDRVRTEDILSGYPNLIDVTSPNRTIPWDYLYNSVENRMALLTGLMDGDGSITERPNREWASPMVRYSTTSKVLADQIIWLCRSLGFECNSYPDRRKRYSSGYCTSLSIRVDPNDLPKIFRVSYKLESAIRCMHQYNDLLEEGSLKWSRYHDKTRIVTVKKLPEPEEVMCIKVDNPEHLYLTEDFVVTHNTGKDSIARMIASEWNRNLYYVTGGKDGRFVPNAITDNGSDIIYPLFLISDIDKYPYLINEADIAMEGESAKEEKIRYKQLFGNMINAMDGVLSGEGRIIIMTTNHIEKFSDVFLRPGRVDLKLEIGYVTPDVFRQYVWAFYEVELPKGIKLKNPETTVAMMQSDVVFMKLTADEFIAKYVKK